MNKLLIFLSVTFCVNLWTASLSEDKAISKLNEFFELLDLEVYEKKGHEFIDVFVNLFDESDEACVMTINLIAIYKLRGSS